MVIYKTTNLVNGKFYIGKDEANDPKYLGSGYALRPAIKKYGISNFKKEILEVCDTREQLSEREIYWIKKYDALNPHVAYNIAEGGSGGNTYAGKTEEQLDVIKSKISKSLKNRHFSKEHREKLSKAASNRKGNKPSPYKGMKLSQILGEEKAKEVSKKISNTLTGRMMDEKTKEKISKSTKGISIGPFSESHKSNIKKSAKARGRLTIEATNTKIILRLDELLDEGISESNYDEARKVFSKAKFRGLDVSKYETISIDLRKINSKRRSNANRNRKKA